MRISPSLFLVAASCLAACADQAVLGPATATSFTGVVISNARPEFLSGAIEGRASFQLVDEDVSYVSIAPKTLPGATKVEISNRTRNLPASLFSLVDGGLDPVALEANAGDSLELNVWKADGSQQPILVKVPAKRPPSVVRTSPSKGRTDVALNVVVRVIFTEPIDTKTVTPLSVQLYRNGKSVSGKVVLEANLWTADLIPDQPLDPDASYDLIVSPTVRDLDGDALTAPYATTFVTGTRQCNNSVDGSECPVAAQGITISGMVFERSNGSQNPVPGAIVDGWAQLAEGSGSRLTEVRTDGNGQYTVIAPAGAMVQLHATVPRFDQPCGVAVDASADRAGADIEVVATAKPQPRAATLHQRMSGTVLELVPDPSRNNALLLEIPVAAVRLILESPNGFVAATTTTDAGGAYAFCQLPALEQRSLSAAKSGFKPYERVLSFGLGGDVNFDLLITRE